MAMVSRLQVVFAQLLHRSRAIALLSVAALLLSGCVDYDVGIHVASSSQGEIVQHLRVGDRLRSLSDSNVRQWTRLIEQRTRSLGGRVERHPNQELWVNIPFSDAKDLETKFNQFFSPTSENNAQATLLSGLPAIQSHLTVHRSNLLFFEHSRVQYDLDLRSLGVASDSGNVLLSPAALVDLEFTLSAPWGARSLATLPVRREPKRLIWKLNPGQENHVDVAFWMPNAIGLGTALILALVIAGQYFKKPFQTATLVSPPSVPL
jgi:Protein of unknown function (DUF3153)